MLPTFSAWGLWWDIPLCHLSKIWAPKIEHWIPPTRHTQSFPRSWDRAVLVPPLHLLPHPGQKHPCEVISLPFLDIQSLGGSLSYRSPCFVGPTTHRAGREFCLVVAGKEEEGDGPRALRKTEEYHPEKRPKSASLPPWRARASLVWLMVVLDSRGNP